jgi:hypothetical protein
MRPDPDHRPAIWEPLRGIGYVALITGCVIVIGSIIAFAALAVGEVPR